MAANTTIADDGIDVAGKLELVRSILIDSAGNELDIFGLFLEIDVYEDLFSPYITGTITMVEAFNLPDSMPMVGEEKLLLEYKTPTTDSVTKLFYITRIDDHSVDSDKKHSYVLHFISEKAYVSVMTKISQPLSGTGDMIIKKVFADHLSTRNTDILLLEQSTNNFKFVPTYWEPMHCISYATSRCANLTNGANDFLFFETMTSHTLASYSTLMGRNIVETVYFDKQSMRIKNEDGSSSRDLQREYRTARMMDYVGSFDTVRRVQQGTLSNAIFGFDLMRKKITITTYDYQRDFGKTEHLEKFPMQSTNMLKGQPGIIQSKVTASQGYDGFALDNTDRIISQRLALLGQLDMFKLDIELPGRSDIKVGQTINFDMPTYKKVNAEDSKNLNKYYSGKYLITAIMHRFTQSRHSMNMQIVKDSVKSELKFGEKV